jgi:hypothetical protein
VTLLHRLKIAESDSLWDVSVLASRQQYPDVTIRIEKRINGLGAVKANGCAVNYTKDTLSFHCQLEPLKFHSPQAAESKTNAAIAFIFLE